MNFINLFFKKWKFFNIMYDNINIYNIGMCEVSVKLFDLDLIII